MINSICDWTEARSLCEGPRCTVDWLLIDGEVAGKGLNDDICDPSFVRSPPCCYQPVSLALSTVSFCHPLYHK